MTAVAGMTSFALYEQNCHAALARYHANLDQMTRKHAYDQLIADLLKAGERFAVNTAKERALAAQHHAAISQALNRIRSNA